MKTSDLSDEITERAQAGDVIGLVGLLNIPEVRSSAKLSHAVLFRTNHFIDKDAAVPVLSRLLGVSESMDARFGAANDLGKLRGTHIVTALRPGVEDEDGRVRARTLESMASADATSAIRYFRTGLSDPSWTVRDRACLGLVEADDASSVSLVVPLLNDESRTVQKAARKALVSLGGDAASEALEVAAEEVAFMERRLLRAAARKARSRPTRPG